MASGQNTTLLEFPCRFPIKAMGRNEDGFEELVTAIVLTHAGLWPEEPIRVTPSKEGTFISVTAVIEATSQQQLDSIYLELSASSQVLMAL
jgi:putative lipoic acid-binding regulatory protein